jgi:uncharacterized protein (TIGR00159 family)
VVDSLFRGLVALLGEIGVSGAIDIALSAALIYAALVVLLRRAGRLLRGALVLGALYVLSRQLDLGLSQRLLEAFAAVAAVALVVIYRDDLREIIERMARGRPWGERRGHGDQAGELAHILAHTLGDLAQARVGALVVVAGESPLEGLAQGGERLDGRPSEALLKSIFDSSSPGHDGAVLIEGGLITRFGCQLPLSHDFEQLKGKGTRHAAALGLAEQSDALCLAASEERGTLSLAERGGITVVSAQELATTLGKHLGAHKKRERRGDWWRSHHLAKLVAIAIAGIGWALFVRGGAPTTRVMTATLEVVDVSDELRVVSLTPESARVTLSGPKSTFYFVNEDNLRLRIPAAKLVLGGNRVALEPAMVNIPEGLSVRAIEPSRVSVMIARSTSGAAPKTSPAPPKARPR